MKKKIGKKKTKIKKSYKTYIYTMCVCVCSEIIEKNIYIARMYLMCLKIFRDFFNLNKSKPK